jgi:hypothetical protein
LKIDLDQNSKLRAWKCGSSGKMPALQAQSPEFQPQYNKNNNKKKTQRKYETEI